VSTLSDWLSDALCSLATGGGFATRALYTDEDEVLFDATRPVILNGVEFATRSDLADRAIFLKLLPIPNSRRRTEEELWASFERKCPFILGALLDAVAYGLRELPNTPSQNYPRMADFVHWITACEGALWEPGTFAEAYAGNRRVATLDVVEADPVANSVRLLMKKQDTWSGTATELLDELERVVGEKEAKRKHWPGSSSVLGARLRRIAAPLRRLNIRLSYDREGSGRTISITRGKTARGGKSLSSLSSPSSAKDFKEPI
jgi:hypothetical protein